MLKTLWCRISSPFFHNGPIWPHAAPSEWIVRNGCPSTIGCICDWKHLFPQPIKHPLASVCCNCADRRTCRRKMHRLQENRARKKRKENHIETREVGKGIKSFYSASSVELHNVFASFYYTVQENSLLTLLIKNIKIPERDGQTSVAHLTAIWFINILLLLKKINKSKRNLIT